MSEMMPEGGLIERELLSGGYISITKGISMYPLFKTGRDVVKLITPLEPLKKYDVVLYKVAEGKYVLHRIIGVRSDEFIIRGDNTYRKEHVKKGRILAVLTEFKRKGRAHKVTDRSYLLYSRFWNFIYPIRYIAYHILMLAYKMYRKIFKKKN